MRELELPMLAAYVDGELDDEAARAVEAALHDRPEAGDVVRKLRESRDWAAAALADVPNEPLPVRLLATVANASPGPARTAPSRDRLDPSRFMAGVTRLAAAIALLAAGGLAGFLVADFRPGDPPVTAAAAPAPSELQVLYAALEHDASGSRVRWHDPGSGRTIGVIPVRTFLEPRDGTVCREYRREVEEPARNAVIHGVACRGASGDWAVRYELIQGAHIDLGTQL